MKKKLGIAALCLVLSFLQIMVLLPNDSVRAVDVGPEVYFLCGNENYTFATTMSFSSITIDSDYIIFNSTGFYVNSSSNIYITLAYLDNDISGAVVGEKILEFYANTTSGNVWFNLSGFQVGRGYVVNRSSTTLANVTANSSGYISFNSSNWSNKLFEIFRGDNSPPYFSNASISNGSTGESIGTSSLNITIADPDGNSFNWTIQTSPDVGSNSGSGAANGSKTCNVSGLAYSTTYTWYVNATDGNASINESYYFTTESEPSNPPSDGGYTPPPPSNKAPTAEANGPYSGYVGQVITFNGSGSTDPDNNTLTYTWKFGDGNNGTGKTPTHSYNLTGLYNVTLTVSDGSLTDNDTTTANITEVIVLIDTDGDGWSNEIEESYETNITDPNSYPLDTDKDGTPDDNSSDGKYTGDTDDDNDGLSDVTEMALESNPKNAADTIQISIDGIAYYLVDINNDAQSEKFYDLTTNTNTTIKIQDGKYLLDINGDGKYEKIYDPATKEITSYEEKKPSNEFPWLLVIIGAIIAIAAIIVILFLAGYIRIEIE